MNKFRILMLNNTRKLLFKNKTFLKKFSNYNKDQFKFFKKKFKKYKKDINFSNVFRNPDMNKGSAFITLFAINTAVYLYIWLENTSDKY